MIERQREDDECVTSFSGTISACTYILKDKGGIEGPAGPANAVPFSEAVCNAGPLFD